MVHLQSLNVLVSSGLNPVAKLTDFGLARVKTETTIKTGAASKAVGGTLRWMSPELFQGKDTSFASDVWALGLVMCEIATADVPFGMRRKDALILTLLQGAGPMQEDWLSLPEDTPLSLRALIMTCLNWRPAARPSADEVAAALTRLLE